MVNLTVGVRLHPCRSVDHILTVHHSVLSKHRSIAAKSPILFLYPCETTPQKRIRELDLSGAGSCMCRLVPFATDGTGHPVALFPNVDDLPFRYCG